MSTPSSFSPPKEIAGLWIGETLPPLAELCIRSFLDHGIAFRLFTYRRYDNVPEGTLLEDASHVLPESAVFRHDNGSLAPFADWFRNTWLERAGGFWTDLDVACLTPELPQTLPWFAEQEPGLIAVGVIGFPPHHPVICKLREVSEDPAAPMPWDDMNERAAKLQFQRDTPDKSLRRRRAEWGNAGPEGFTRALKHFGLLNAAAPSHSIYPLHYTVWRNCYNGSLQLESAELHGAWAIHLWGELLRREPDAFENVNRGSIVGQLLDKHMPQPISRAAVVTKRQVRILVGVCSCAGAQKRRDTIRHTWMQHAEPGIECRFFMGHRDAVQENDVISLWVNDNYDHLPEKVLAFFRYALENYDFEWLFKCDDDTWIDLARLAHLPDERYDLIGDPSLEVRGAPSGGAGYLLSRAMVEKIVAEKDIPSTGAEDLILGQLAVKLGARYLATDRLNLNNTPYPMNDNDLVTAHWCGVEQLEAIEAFHNLEPIAEYQGNHTYWKDTLAFYANGTFRRKATGCAGKYVFHGSRKLTLKWFCWPPESLIRENDSYSGSALVLTRKANQPHWNELPGQETTPDTQEGPLLIQLGCGVNQLPGWINLDLPRYNITRPLPWEDASVDAFFLEHVIEHVLPAQAYDFFLEAWRTLKPGGILRLAFPDILRIARLATPEYIRFLQSRGWGDGTPASALRNAICNHGHQAIWTIETMHAVLESIGYEVTSLEVGESAHQELCRIESHDSQLGTLFNEIETSCIEARKPGNAPTEDKRR